jgi:hypothetical protein
MKTIINLHPQIQQQEPTSISLSHQDGLQSEQKNYPILFGQMTKSTKQNKKFIPSRIANLQPRKLEDRISQLHKKVKQELINTHKQFFGAWNGEIHGGKV